MNLIAENIMVYDHAVPSTSGWKTAKSNLAELIDPCHENSVIKLLFKTGKKWHCEIIDTGEVCVFEEKDFQLL